MNKKSIAFLTRSLIDATGRNMLKGIITGCKKDKIPLVTFRGPILNKGEGSIIYHLLTDDSFSGIISWASSDVDKKTTDFYKRFQKTPLVCMTFQVEGKPSIVTDCKTGLIELIDHLVDVHHFTKIAFIRGPETHIYAKERYEGYLEGLKKHGLQANPALISECGGWAIADGEKALSNWLNKGLKPGKDFDAVVAVGDNVAIGAQEELIRQGYSVPHDVAVCGFNGTDDAAWSNPPITSVEMPFYKQGLQGYETLSAMLQNKEYSKLFRYKTRLILGESCGCTSTSVNHAAFEISADLSNSQEKKLLKKAQKANFLFGENLISETFSSSEWKNELSQKILQTVQNDFYTKEEITIFFTNFMPKFVDSFSNDILSKEPGALLKTVTIGLNNFEKISKNFNVWQDIISTIRTFALLTMNCQCKIYKKCENLFQQARVLISEFDCRTQKQANLLASRKESVLRQISTDILSCSNLDKLFEIITKALPKIDISSCYIALYNDCHYTEENQEIPQTSQLVLAIKKGERISLPEGGLTFKTTEIIPNSINNSDEYAIYEVESLNIQNTYLGYIVFESETASGITYATLREQISCAISSSNLLEERTKSQDLLQTTMHVMSDKADVVSNQSESITSNITNISTSMDSVVGNIKDISGNIRNVADTVTSANQMITDADKSIKTLVHITEEITHAIDLINDIAEKTNVLALNAAIEAAHAGDAGRGFSVVAKEVKALAAQTVSSTSKIQELVKKNNLSTKQAEEVINSTNKAIKTIASLSENIKDSINEQVQSSTEISNRLQDASTGIEQISSAIAEIAKLGLKLKK